MRLKIVSNGQKTHVVDAETGRELEGVTAVRWKHAHPGHVTEAVFKVIDVPCDIEVEGKAE